MQNQLEIKPENGNKSKPLLQDVLDFEIEEIFNKTILTREKPHQLGFMSFPRNYMQEHWQCLKVRRLSDNVLMVKELTITDKGSILYFKFRHPRGEKKICIIGTVLGEYDINDVVVLNIL